MKIKYASIILLIMSLIVLTFAGCGKTENNSVKIDDTNKSTVKQVEYKDAPKVENSASSVDTTTAVTTTTAPVTTTKPVTTVPVATTTAPKTVIKKVPVNIRTLPDGSTTYEEEERVYYIVDPAQSTDKAPVKTPPPISGIPKH